MSDKHDSPWLEGLGHLAAAGEVALVLVAIALVVASVRWIVRLARRRAS